MGLDEVYPKYNGKPIVPTKGASNELMETGLSLDDIKEILEKGFDCSRSKRKSNKIEKGIQKGRYFNKAVVVEKLDRWILIHVGQLVYSKSLKKKLRRKK